MTWTKGKNGFLLNLPFTLKKTKNVLFGGSKMVLLKSFKFVFLGLFFNVKGSFMPIFTKKIIFGPPGIFWKLKTCSDRSNKISTLHPNVQDTTAKNEPRKTSVHVLKLFTICLEMYCPVILTAISQIFSWSILKYFEPEKFLFLFQLFIEFYN